MTDSSALVEMHTRSEFAVEGGSAPALFLQQARAAERFFDFFTANIRNKHTRRAYYNAACSGDHQGKRASGKNSILACTRTYRRRMKVF
jgi:hypothetical protein